MSKMIEMLHRGHRGSRPHLATQTLAARPRQLVGAARPVPTNDSVSSPSEAISNWIPDAPTTDSSLNASDSAGEVSDLSPSQEGSASSSDSKECDALNPMLESALETLQKLETIRPFDHVEPHAEQERHSPVQADTIEPKSISALETPLDSISRRRSSVITGLSVEGRCDEIAEKSVRRRFRVHQSTPLSLESGQAGDGTEISKDAWAANVLAVCGGLLILAGILYVAVDMMFWF